MTFDTRGVECRSCDRNTQLHSTEHIIYICAFTTGAQQRVRWGKDVIRQSSRSRCRARQCVRRSWLPCACALHGRHRRLLGGERMARRWSTGTRQVWRVFQKDLHSVALVRRAVGTPGEGAKATVRNTGGREKSFLWVTLPRRVVGRYTRSGLVIAKLGPIDHVSVR